MLKSLKLPLETECMDSNITYLFKIIPTFQSSYLKYEVT